ncbi:MAG TPA: beta-phosphoglucomutase family hydrolase [Bryobacteraceae bacterium]|nr:beta-phosphoglucomutase family hydrolase [Bryobacteraceae bacterium]
MEKPAPLSECRLAPGLALIFDMDGVIIDSNPVHRQAWAAFNRRFGLEISEQMYQRTNGWRNDQIVRYFFGDSLSAEEVDARGAAKEALYREMIGDRIEEMLVPGVRQFLERYRGAPMGLATNAEPANVDFLLDRGGLRPYFRAVVDGSQVSRPKPDPEIYLRTAEMLVTAPANCIVFEDSHSGVEAAGVANMRIVLVGTTYGDLPGSNITIDNFFSGYLSEWLGVQRRID